MPMASVAGKARVDVPATISDRWRALMVKMDAVRRFRSSLARFRSRKAKSEEHLIDDPSMSEDIWYSDDNETFSCYLSVSVDLKTEDEISSILQERSLRELNPTFPVGSKHAPHFQSSRAVMHEKVKNSPTDLPHSLRGVRSRRGVRGFLVEIRPNKWKNTIWLGTYDTPTEAARAYDAGIFYFRKKIDLNFHDSVTSFVAIPPVSLEEAHKSASNKNEFIVFVREQAAKAARRALDDPEWKRTYDEWWLQGKNQNQETSGFESPSYSRPAFGPDFPCTTDDHLKQENQFSTIGISDTTENCFQTGLQEILTKGRKGKFEGADSIEFLFKHAEDMSKVVGVGLQWSKVVVTKQFGVVVQHIGEHSWSDLWKETSFSPMRIPIPKPPPKLSMCNLTPEQSSKSFGVGLVGSRLENNRVYVEDNQNQTGEMFPFIFELAEKMGLSENAKDSNFQHPSSISSEAVEGEKNDHGGPLLETMEGGGETDQGGTSSEPMDVGESSQGGNSGEPMKGVESGQGGPSSGPTEVGGQRDEQSSNLQQRFESLQAKGPQDSNENKSLTVTVIPEIGGTFYDGLSNWQVQPDRRINGAAIAPLLKFKFEILGGERKITTTTETRCDLGRGQLTLHEDWDLGYCHDNITISLTCEDPQAVRVSPGTVVATDVMKRAMTETFTGSMSHANQIVETSNTQFSGFNVNQLECAGSLVFNFLYPEEIVDVKDTGKRQFIHAGINKTLWPTIVGKWFPLDREEARLYKFKADRDIHSIGSLMRFMQQKYEVPFVINHAMSHIHYYEDIELRGPGVKSVERVLTKYPEV
ncbi:unnamed protein product [Sphagnum compactum]